jgi:apolipoprotein N-acyltransferase
VALAPEGKRGARWRTAAWLLLAACGGLLWAAQFATEPFTVAPWLALAPLVVLLGGPRPGWLAWLHGVVYWLAAIPWIVPTLITYGGIATWLAWLLLVLLAAYLAIFWGLFGWLGARLWRGGGWASLLALPALWVALEWLRGWLFSGFPWNLAAYAWVEVPGALPAAAWIGPWGVSFLVALANVGVATMVARRGVPRGVFALLVPLVVLPLAGRYALPAAPHASGGQPVRVLQPNIANLAAYDPEPVLRNYRRVTEMSELACDVPGALVVWPESAGWPFSYPSDPGFQNDLLRLVGRGCPLLFNTAFREGEDWRNAAFLLTPGGGEARADKRHLVPFGEYVPLAPLFPFLDRLARNAGDFSPAKELSLLDWGRERLGTAICFEVTFPGEVAEAVRAGASVLVTITNDAWYGDTAAPWQHYRAARFRAAENGRPLVRAAITGVSALVRADGRVAAELGVFRQGTLRGTITGRTDLTPFSRVPWIVPALCALIAAVGVVVTWKTLPGR